MLALTFMTMLPRRVAGGNVGEHAAEERPEARPNNWMMPPRSPTFMMPSHRLITPTRPIEDVEARLGWSRTASEDAREDFEVACSALRKRGE